MIALLLSLLRSAVSSIPVMQANAGGYCYLLEELPVFRPWAKTWNSGGKWEAMDIIASCLVTAQ